MFTVKQHGAYPQEVPSTVPLNIPAESYHYTQPDQLNNGSIIPQQQQYPERKLNYNQGEKLFGSLFKMTKIALKDLKHDQKFQIYVALRLQFYVHM